MKIPREHRGSAAWLYLKEQMVARREDLRRQNDSDRPMDETAKLRGRIAEITAWIEADQDPAPVPEAPPES